MFRVLLLLSLPLLLAGCAISEEEKSFYFRGWLNPKSLDEEPPATQYGGTPIRGKYKRDPIVD